MLKNKKGFSLVELIVVIAIMAVLVGILAPTLIGYVEKSRTSKDESAIDELENAIELAVAEEDIFNEVIDGATFEFEPEDGVITLEDDGDDYTNLFAKINETIGETIELTSKTHKKDTVKVTITVASTGNVTVKAEFVTATAS